MNRRFSTFAIIPSLGLLMACGAKSTDHGNTNSNLKGVDTWEASGAGEFHSQDIPVVGGCTLDKCSHQAVGCLAGGSPQNMVCAPSPRASTGSVPADSCELRATCEGGPKIFAVTYTGGCNPDSCFNQAVACVTGVPENVTCAPHPYAGTGSAAPDSCELTCTCSSADD
jgi:hypothetical protein